MAELEVTHSYAHPPEAVFDAWLDPAKARRFLFATPTGEMVKAEVDARVGGKFEFVDRRPDAGDVSHVGEYEVIDRPRRLVFTFAVPQYDPGITRVTLDFRSTDKGCEVTLSHTGVPPEWRDQTVEGWTMILASLEAALG